MTTGGDASAPEARHSQDDDSEVTPSTTVRPWRRAAGVVATVLACLLVLFGLVLPLRLNDISPAAFLRIPIEGLVVVALLLVLPPRARKIVGIVAGVLLGIVTIVKLLDIGFFESLGRPFDPGGDWAFFGPGIDFLNGAIGHIGAIIAIIAVILVAIALVVLMTLAVLRISRVANSGRTATSRILLALGVAWVVFLVTGVQVAPGTPVAARDAADLTVGNVQKINEDIKDQQVFAQQMATDKFAKTPGNELLTGLRGKNVILVVVESYGQVAVQGSPIAPQIDTMLRNDTKQLQAAGFGSRSAFLTSSTDGGGSWLAHSTLESGVFINSQQRYNEFTSSHRLTLSSAFRKAGWRNVGVIPENTEDWPQGAVYQFQKIYDDRNVGYQGPGFAYSNMPDQYTMTAFRRAEQQPGHKPVFAEIDLTSSHSPWTHQPRLVDWNAVGDGSIYDPMPTQGKSFDQVWPNPVTIRQAYGQSIQYSLTTLVQYMQRYADKNTVMVFYGDHQPEQPVVQPDHVHRVPISIIAKDPAVLQQVSGWGWDNGLLPSPQAPLWLMSAFRDKFLTAFSRTS
jgi:phosphoglycerol transferase MdoB-like AlkP superfamily enzyme